MFYNRNSIRIIFTIYSFYKVKEKRKKTKLKLKFFYPAKKYD